MFDIDHAVHAALRLALQLAEGHQRITQPVVPWYILTRSSWHRPAQAADCTSSWMTTPVTYLAQPRVQVSQSSDLHARYIPFGREYSALPSPTLRDRLIRLSFDPGPMTTTRPRAIDEQGRTWKKVCHHTQQIRSRQTFHSSSLHCIEAIV